jgi:hypothetical protein
VLSNQTGICLEESSSSVKLPARGNKFLGGRDCSISTATLSEVVLPGACEELLKLTPVTFSDVAWITAGSVDVSTCH